ncbi:MAG: antitoxin VapB family protein [Actinomycetota bacterium]
MRTTIEIPKEQHIALIELAARLGLRGFSPLVEEAIGEFLETQNQTKLADALGAEGILNEEQAQQIEKNIDEAWASWIPTS